MTEEPSTRDEREAAFAASEHALELEERRARELETDAALDRRLLREADELMGILGDPATTTDTARVDVSYTNREGREHAGHYIAHVKPAALADDAAQLEQHPATLAAALVHEYLERLAARCDWQRFSVDDVTGA